MIPVRNVYYMLAYAFRALREQRYRDMAAEEFQNDAELLAEILCRGVSAQVRRGLQRTYVSKTEPLSVPHGKLEISESVKTQAVRKKQMVCSYDAFLTDTYMNRILRAAMESLLHADISGVRKRKLKKLLLYFHGVSPLDVRRIDWKPRGDRAGQTYEMLSAVCRFVLQGLLQSTKSGPVRMMDYMDDQSMARLYEKFILEYFRREHPELRAGSPQIPWCVEDGGGDDLPIMQSDVVLKDAAANRTLILDAKYYSHNMNIHGVYGSKTMISPNLYQIFTYVKNWKSTYGGIVSGLLLYARSDEDVQPPNRDYRMSGNRIGVRTLDLSVAFSDIAAELDAIAASL